MAALGVDYFESASPASLFTLIALIFTVLYLISRVLYQKPSEIIENESSNLVTLQEERIQIGDITLEELSQYNGLDPSKPLLMAIKGIIYDVSYSSQFYGPGGPYGLFAGKDASCALAKMSFEEGDIHGDTSKLSYSEKEVLNDWAARFEMKYKVVGHVIPSPVEDERKEES